MPLIRTGKDLLPMTDTKPSNNESRLRTIWGALVGLIATISGLLPHVLHHIGLVAGTAIIVGAGGTVIFGVIGLIAAIPFLLRLHRRFNNWQAPAIALVIFVIMFSISAFVVGPAIRSSSNGNPPSTEVNHEAHHKSE